MKFFTRLILMFSLLPVCFFAAAQSWSINGNAGTNPVTNFIGTTDVKPLLLKVSAQKAGYLDSNNSGIVSFGYKALLNTANGDFSSAFGYKALMVNTAICNTAVGYKTLYSNTSGLSNTAMGSQALYSNIGGRGNTAVGKTTMLYSVSGSENTALGNEAMYFNTNGSYNTATGSEAMRGNATGNYNTAQGYYALAGNRTGNNNTAFGADALKQNNAGYSNTAAGFRSLFSNLAGHSNSAFGDSALYSNASGSYNIAIGKQSMFTNNTGGSNTAVGDHALYSNTGGGANTAIGTSSLYGNTTGDRNVAIGGALVSNKDGNLNVACGYQALRYNQHGSNNTAVGNYTLLWNQGSNNTATGENALVNNTDGTFNTANGMRSGEYSVSGSYCSFFGVNADQDQYAAYTNSTALGHGATVTGSNQVMIGNNLVGSIGGHVEWSIFPDARIKSNVHENIPGLNFINLLRPVSYTDDQAKENELIFGRRTGAKIPGDERTVSKTIFTGFLAQEVDGAAQKINYNFSGVDKSGPVMGLRYAEFVVPIVKAVQELSHQNDSLKNENDIQQKQIDNLQQQINELKALVKPADQQVPVRNHIALNAAGSSLEQNVPNPSGSATSIYYTLPSKFLSAQIVVTDQGGKTLQQINLKQSGRNVLDIDARSISSGVYSYSLFVDGRLIDTKGMIIAK